jgi:hypothetical protein
VHGSTTPRSGQSGMSPTLSLSPSLSSLYTSLTLSLSRSIPGCGGAWSSACSPDGRSRPLHPSAGSAVVASPSISSFVQRAPPSSGGGSGEIEELRCGTDDGRPDPTVGG